MLSEKERENHVYLAKLAEQAERYDGYNFDLDHSHLFILNFLI